VDACIAKAIDHEMKFEEETIEVGRCDSVARF